jgi:hypothetical protein
VIGSQTMPDGQDASNRGFAGPLATADPESLMKRPEWIPNHGLSVGSPPDKIKSCFRTSMMINLSYKAVYVVRRRCVGRSEDRGTLDR